MSNTNNTPQYSVRTNGRVTFTGGMDDAAREAESIQAMRPDATVTVRPVEGTPPDAPAAPESVPGLPFTPELNTYAALLIQAGFTVYVPAKPERRPTTFFHYSRDVETPSGPQTCYGTVNTPQFRLLGEPFSHTMPIHPSRLNGSSALIDPAPGDPNPGPHELSVEYARRVARPENYAPYCSEPTPEAVRLANAGAGVPRRMSQGATLRNAEPWGIGTHYLPVTPSAKEAI